MTTIVQTRISLTGEDVSQAILNAGIELRPEDQMAVKFSQIADELSHKVRDHARREIEKFSARLTWEVEP